jgi:sugar phosphate isomerase/epimerase
MRFGLCTGDVEIVRQLGSWGYDYAEIGGQTVLPFENDQTFAAVKTRLIDSGVPIEGLAGFIPGSVPVIGPNVDWAQVRGYLETTVGRAAELGVKAINWGSVASRRVPPGWPMSRAWEQIEHAAGLIADVAARSGVVVAIESVNPREANILFYVTESIQLAQTIGRPSLQVLVDYYHVVKQNEPLEHISAAASLLVHAHTSDDNRGFPALDGGWDQRPFLRALANAGYDQRLSFEVRRRDDRPFEAEARQSVQRMRELWREHATEGGIASKGLRTSEDPLRGIF